MSESFRPLGRTGMAARLAQDIPEGGRIERIALVPQADGVLADFWGHVMSPEALKALHPAAARMQARRAPYRIH